MRSSRILVWELLRVAVLPVVQVENRGLCRKAQSRSALRVKIEKDYATCTALQLGSGMKVWNATSRTGMSSRFNLSNVTSHLERKHHS
jgi:hypothetical protein